MSMNLIPGIESTGSALSAEKIRLEIIAQNIANSNTTQMPPAMFIKEKKLPSKNLSKPLKEEFLVMLMKIYIKVFA